MCDDNEECGAGDASSALAMLLMPGVQEGLEGFIAHMRRVLPDFADGVDQQLLVAVFCAGRTHALQYAQRQTEVVVGASDHQIAMSLAVMASQRGLDVFALQANMQKWVQSQRQPENVQ